MINSKMLSGILRDKCKESQKKSMLDTLTVSTNQPDLKSINDIEVLIQVLENLPEDKKYNALYDPNIDEGNKKLLALNKPALDSLNKINRTTQINLLKSVKDVKVVGVLETLIDEIPKLILQHLLLNVSEVFQVVDDKVVCKLTLDEITRV